MIKNPYANYKEQSISTMTKGEMLKTLYDVLLKKILQSKKALEKKDFTVANAELQKSQLIIQHLQKTLDTSYDISGSLNSLYDYCNRLLVDVNIKKDPAQLDEVAKIITGLRDAYVQADKNLRTAEFKK